MICGKVMRGREAMRESEELISFHNVSVNGFSSGFLSIPSSLGWSLALILLYQVESFVPHQGTLLVSADTWRRT